MAYAILVFFFLVFCLLFVNVETRRAVYITPIWLVILGLMYLRYKNAIRNTKK